MERPYSGTTLQKLPKTLTTYKLVYKEGENFYKPWIYRDIIVDRNPTMVKFISYHCGENIVPSKQQWVGTYYLNLSQNIVAGAHFFLSLEDTKAFYKRCKAGCRDSSNIALVECKIKREDTTHIGRDETGYDSVIANKFELVKEVNDGTR